MSTFLCKNCKFKQHQCYACGELGSSDKSSDAKVWACCNSKQTELLFKCWYPDVGLVLYSCTVWSATWLFLTLLKEFCNFRTSFIGRKYPISLIFRLLYHSFNAFTISDANFSTYFLVTLEFSTHLYFWLNFSLLRYLNFCFCERSDFFLFLLFY